MVPLGRFLANIIHVHELLGHHFERTGGVCQILFGERNPKGCHEYVMIYPPVIQHSTGKLAIYYIALYRRFSMAMFDETRG